MSVPGRALVVAYGPITRERIIIARKWARYYGDLNAYRDTSMYFFSASKFRLPKAEARCRDAAFQEQFAFRSEHHELSGIRELDLRKELDAWQKPE